jgi:hypothetical protein
MDFGFRMGVVRGILQFASPLAAVKCPLHNILDEKSRVVKLHSRMELGCSKTRVETRGPQRLLVGSALYGRDIATYPQTGQTFGLVFLHSKVMWSPLHNHFRRHSRIHLDFTILTTTCFQFSNVEYLSFLRMSFKGQSHYVTDHLFILFCFVTLRPPNRHPPPPLALLVPLESP